MYYPYYYYSSVDPSLVVAIVIGALLLALLVFIAWCRMFIKAGMPWERMFVPLYGAYAQYSICDSAGLFWLTIALSVGSALLFPMLSNSSYETLMIFGIVLLIICLVIYIVYCIRLARAFGKGGGFALGLILLYPIFIMILGFGSAEHGSATERALFAQTATWTCRSCGTINPAHRGECEMCKARK